jgi:hypothetical protein
MVKSNGQSTPPIVAPIMGCLHARIRAMIASTRRAAAVADRVL